MEPASNKELLAPYSYYRNILEEIDPIVPVVTNNPPQLISEISELKSQLNVFVKFKPEPVNYTKIISGLSKPTVEDALRIEECTVSETYYEFSEAGQRSH